MNIIGQTISHYHILEKLGEGGMGVVYKAQDLNLDRLVALKFLPQPVTKSETEKARFIQEAKATAALSHPNICAIHSIEKEGEEFFLVIDYVDGQTLRQKMVSGLIPINLALDIGAQIADGLGAAHELGVVHRDIKPENIMIRKDGLVQIMDFGLAKLRGVSRLTKEGSTIGTMGYMSPEQVLGHDVDARTDIFSLGVVLYELLTGQLPFKAVHEAAIMYEIVNIEAPLISSIRRDASPELTTLVADCMTKERNERIQSAKEISRLLKRYNRDPNQQARGAKGIARGLSIEPEAPAATNARQTKLHGSRSRLLLIGGVILLAGACALYFAHPFHNVPVLNPNRTSHILETQLPPGGYPTLSADGNWVAFPVPDAKGVWEVYLMHVSGGGAHKVTTVRSRTILMTDFSRDGSRIAFSSFNYEKRVDQLNVVPSFGGTSSAVVEGAWYLKWRPDSRRIGYLIESNKSESHKLELWSVQPDGNDKRLEFLDSMTTFNSSIAFSWSPDGKAVAWLRSFAGEYQEIIIHDLHSGTERQLTFDKVFIDEVCWTNQDEIIFSSKRGGNQNLWTIPSAGGDPQQITFGRGPDSQMQVSADGKRMVYLQGESVGHVWLQSLEGIPAHQVTFDHSNILSPQLSPDRKQVAFYTFDSTECIYVIDRDGTNRRQLTARDWRSRSPKWSPNGRWIVFIGLPATSQDDSTGVYLIDASNPREPKFVSKGFQANWMDDTTLIILRQGRSWSTPINGGVSKHFFVDSTWARPILSGKYILFMDGHAGRDGYWLISAEHQNESLHKWARKVVEPAEALLYSPTKFIVMRRDGNGIGLWNLSLPDGKRQKLQFPSLDPGWSFTGGISYDGKEIVYTNTHMSSTLEMVENLFK